MEPQEQIRILQETTASLQHALIQTLNYLDEMNTASSDRASKTSRLRALQHLLNKLLLLSRQSPSTLDMGFQEEIHVLRETIINLQWALLQALSYLDESDCEETTIDEFYTYIRITENDLLSTSSCENSVL